MIHDNEPAMRRNMALGRNKRLAVAIVAALSMGTIGSAAADGLWVLGGATTFEDYLQSIVNGQAHDGNLGALATGNQMGAASPAAGEMTVSANVVQALTLDPDTGLLGVNGADNAISLELLGSDPDNAGSGILSSQEITGAIEARVQGNGVGLEISDYTSGTATISDNQMAATSLANAAGNRIEGELAVAPFSGTRAGSASADYSPTGASVAIDGDLVVGNAQFAQGLDSMARIRDNDIALVNTMTAVGTATAAPVTVAGNSAVASNTVNRADNRVDASSGGAASFTGGVAVVNGQANIDGITRASVLDTDIGAQLDDTTYGGEMSVSGNRIVAAAKGNDAAAVDAQGRLLRGNAIAFGEGIDVSGASAGGDLHLAFGDDVFDGDADADLALLNSQGNQGGRVTGAALESRIGARMTTLSGGRLALADNRADASASGNSAINLVSAGGANFGAGVAAGSQQANDAVAIGAEASDITLGATIGDIDSGSIVIGNSAVTASAQGNSAQVAVDVAGSQLETGGADASVDSRTAGFTSLDAEAGLVAGSLQANYGAGTEIGATVENVVLGVTAGSLDTGTFTVQDNEVSARAGGNSASTGVSASGATGALTAAAANGQYNANDIAARLHQAGGYVGVQVEDGDGRADSTFVVSGNSLAASASGSESTNTLAADFASGLSVQAGTAPASIIAGMAGVNQASAGLAVTNSQINDGANVTSSVRDGQIGVQVGGTVDSAYDQRDSVSIEGNASTASSVGNRTGNALAISAGNLVPGASSGAIGVVSNLQLMTGNVSARNLDATIGFQTQADWVGPVSAAIDGNSIAAFTGGNMTGAGNRLTVSATNIAASGAGAVLTMDGSNSGVAAAFAVQSVQASTAGEREALVDGATIGVEARGPGELYDESTLTVNGNGISADARDNYAENALVFEGAATVGTTGAVQNHQASGAALSSSVADTTVGVLGQLLVNDQLTVTGNDIAAKSVANTATSQLLVEAANLDGAGVASMSGVPAEYRGAADAGGAMYTLADFAVANRQQTSGSTIESEVTNARVAIDAQSDALRSNETVATVDDNSILALGQANSSTNAMAVTGANIAASAATHNHQVAGNSVEASVRDVGFIVVAATGVEGAMPLTLTGNSAAAMAGLNEASNSVVVDADGTIAGSVGLAAASSDATRFDAFAGAVADFAIANSQVATGAATSELDNATAGIGAAASIGVDTDSSALTVSDNTLAASAMGNNAGNTVLLNAAGAIGATAAIHSDQEKSGGAVKASISGAFVAVATPGDLLSANTTLADNRIAASASANSVVNAIGVQGAVLNAAGVATEAGSAGVDASTAVANYALNSVQSNASEVSATVTLANIRGRSNGGMIGGAETVDGNSVSASASGNTASNSVLLAAATGTPSAAIANTQVNTAAISASVTSAAIGILAGDGTNSPATVAGNVISATATGNSAVNHIGVGR